MRYVSQNSCFSAMSTNRVSESTNHKHKNTGAGHNFQSTNAKCESIPKLLYLSGIVTYEDDQTVVFHSNAALIFSPSHKRTEGRAQVWISEFITKAATLQGDSSDFAAGKNEMYGIR